MLNEAEAQWLQRVAALDEPAQCLYLRLLLRVGPDFRMARLDYPEIGNLDEPAAELEAAGFLQRADGLQPQQALALYTRVELLHALGESLDLSASTPKHQLSDALHHTAPAPAQLLERLTRNYPGDIVTPLEAGMLPLLQLLFFGNRRQSLTDFLLSDLGLFRYYPVELRRDQRFFESRSAIAEYLLIGEWADAWEVVREAKERDAAVALAQSILDHTLVHESSRSRRDSLCNRIGRELERRDELACARQLYQLSDRHPARERRARIAERETDHAGAAELCEEILSAPRCEAELEAAQRILPRMQRKLGQPPTARPRDCFNRLDLCIDAGEGRVEWLAAAALEAHWETVVYVENSLFNALFGLAFWDVLFAPVAGAWFHPFQDAPADLYEPSFATHRTGLLDACWAALASDDLEDILLATYERCRGYRNRWVDWRYIQPELLSLAIRQIPREHLLAIWRRQWFDLRENRNGFPDLIAFREGEYCLIEVKGPGDTLQDNQKRWLRFFAANDIPYDVAWVTWTDD